MNKKHLIRLLVPFILMIAILLLFFVNAYMSNNRKNEEHTSEETSTDLESEKEMDEELLATVSKTAVKITTDSLHGSGSIYSIEQDRIILITAKHLMEYAIDPVITFADGSTAIGQGLMNADQVDVSFVEVKCEDLSEKTLTFIQSIQQKETLVTKREDENAKPYLGQQIFAVGSCDDVGKTIYVSEVIGVEAYYPEFHSFMFECEGEAVAGMSGAGVFDEGGFFIGMLLGGNEKLFVSIATDDINEAYLQME